jgi:DNA-binding NarL/FixJ family response regulator
MPTQRPDWIGLMEAAYGLGGSGQDWLTAVIDAALPVIAIPGAPVSAYTFRVTPTAFTLLDIAVAGPPQIADMTRRTNEAAAPAEIDQLYRTGTYGGTLSELIFRRFPAARGRFLEQTGGLVRDVVGWCSHSGDGRGIMLNISLADERATRPEERRRWARAGAHLAAGLRLRSNLAEAEAVLGSDGRVHDLVGPAALGDSRQRLRTAVLARERARAASSTDDTDGAMAAWEGLVAGRWSLIDRFEENGRRFVVAVPNDPAVPDPRGLTRRERQVAELVGHGQATKRIAYALGLAPSTVDTAAMQAARKLGLAGRAELAAFFSPAGLRAKLAEVALAGERLLVGSVASLSEERVAPLTQAERDVAAALLAGATVAAIAQRRGSSAATVQTQIASVYRKLGARSRAELAARLMGVGS